MSSTATFQNMQVAVFGGGCFWCLEAIFERIPGVVAVTSGYAGGHVADPSYAQVCSGQTGHAEVIRVRFAADEVDYKELLEVFWQAHDPTQRDGQGPDRGTQYRSIIFTLDDKQDQEAQISKTALASKGDHAAPIATQIEPLQTFYVAEDYHQHYYSNNLAAPYCQMRIRPKLEKLATKLV